MINDLSDVSEVRNTAGTTKQIINFSRKNTTICNKICNAMLGKLQKRQIFSKTYQLLKGFLHNALNSRMKVKGYQLHSMKRPG